MAAGSIAAGLVDGYVRGLGLRRQMNREDEEAKAREEDRAWRKEQQDWMRRERQADDEIDRRLSAVPTTAEKWGSDYSSAAASGAPMRDDEGNLMPGVQSTPRAYRDVLTEQAAAVRGVGGRRGVATAHQLEKITFCFKYLRLGGKEKTKGGKIETHILFRSILPMACRASRARSAFSV